MAVQAVSAGGLRIHFTGFDVGAGRVWLHAGDPENGVLRGPWAGQGPLGDGDFWTEFVDGESAYIEYSPADGQPGGAPPFSVPEIFHLWAFSPKDVTNLGCFLDVTCYTGNAYIATFSKAVAYLVFSDHTCSGTLINDRNSTNTPYLLTAGHCVLDSDDARSMLAVFAFKAANCNGTVGRYTTYPQVSGSTLLARNLHTPDGGQSIIADQPDYAFVRLTNFPATATIQMGWSTSASSSDRMTSVSHPRNLPQKLAVGNIISSSDPNFYTIHMNQGATDHGSSGSGLINDNDQLVALDSFSHNAESVSACDISDRDYGYTRFSAIYPSITTWLEAAGQAKAVVSLSPAALNFGSQQAATTSGAQSAVLTNIGKAALAISSITITGANAGEFAQTNNCGTSLAAGASCKINVTFRPANAASKSATVSITDNADGSPHTVSLSGTGTTGAATPVILNNVTTNINVLANGGNCYTPSPVTSFPVTAAQVWLYFDITGASLTDVFHISYYKPDGTLYTTTDAPSAYPGYECFSYVIGLAGYLPASLPGNWTIKVFWNQQTTPLFTRGFTLSTATNPISTSALQLVPVAPCRVLDTRNANGTYGGPYIDGGSSRSIPIPGTCGVPGNAAAYSLNLTVVPRAGTLSSLVVWPAGLPLPNVSALTSPDGAVLADAAIVPAGTGGAISAYASNDSDLIIDINGYFVPPGAGTLQFYPLTPCRVLDTRNSNGTFGGPRIGTVSRSFPIPSSSCGVPANAAAYSFNVTAVPTGPLGYLTAWPTGQGQPLVSTLNSYDGRVLANAAIVPAGVGGAVSFFASNSTDIVLDINGYFAPPGAGGLNFHALTSCRAVDTRGGADTYGAPTLSAAVTRGFTLAGRCGLPGTPTAQAYSLNIGVVPKAPLGYLSIWPAGGAQPVVSTLNSYSGLAVSNAALVPAGSGGLVSLFATSATDVLIDTAGYFGQ
jgi:hypothetical protein